MGLAAPELIWMGMIPIAAALAGGKRLATVCAIGITLGVVGLAIRGAIHPFPQSTPGPLLAGIAMVSLAGVAVAGAVMGQIYERAVGAALEEQRRSWAASRTPSARARPGIAPRSTTCPWASSRARPTASSPSPTLRWRGSSASTPSRS